jgi:hypothetical protein
MALTIEQFRARLGAEITALTGRKEGEAGYEAWLRKNFPHVASAPLSDRHKRLWSWFENLTPDTALNPRVEVWPRGGAKSSTAELGTTYVGDGLK